jgi:hypothetical protein
MQPGQVGYQVGQESLRWPIGTLSEGALHWQMVTNCFPAHEESIHSHSFCPCKDSFTQGSRPTDSFLGDDFLYYYYYYCYYYYCYYCQFFETGSCYVVQAGFKLLSSRDLSASASQVAGTTGMCHHAPSFTTSCSYLHVKSLWSAPFPPPLQPYLHIVLCSGPF